MSVPSAVDVAQKDHTASTITLALPQLAGVDNGSQTPSKPAPDFNPDAEQLSYTEKELHALEDEEWLENPAHPRNWSPGKKWANMAIVSEFLYHF